MAEKLKIISLGGLNEIGKNITVLEYGGDMIVVDCGLGFPEDDMYGVDLVVPDVTYLIKNQQKLRGFFLTHGHEDHIGGLPYVLEQVNAPVHTTRLTAGLVQIKLEEHGLLDSTKIVTHEAGEVVKAGCFKVEFIHVNHSIADAVAFAIHTPVGVVVMTGDFKIDSTPISGNIIDLARFGALGNKGVLALLCDSTNVEREGFSPSERKVSRSFDSMFKGCDQRIIVTTFASNVDRIQTVLNVAAKYGRKVAVTGRSMENILKVSMELGYLDVPKNTLVDINATKSLPKEKTVIITTGSQGENMSALYRMAFSGHRQVEIRPRRPGADFRICHPRQRKDHFRRDQRAVPEGCRSGVRQAGRSPCIRPCLPGRAEDHACTAEAQVLYSRARRAAAPAAPCKAGPGDGDGSPPDRCQRHWPCDRADP